MFRSTIAQKLVMAVTGTALLIFVIAHAVGNLQIFIGKDLLNSYAAFLQGTPQILWPARIGLLLVFIVHIFTAFQLKKQNRAARPKKYKVVSNEQASLASRYMFESGLVILIFVIVHILRLTMGILQPENFHLIDDQGRHDVYSILILGFQNHYYSLGYIICMLFLGAHLSHAISSVLQTVGFHHFKSLTRSQIQSVGSLIGWAIALLYILIPFSVLTGILSI